MRERDFAGLRRLEQLSLWNAQLNVRSLPPNIFSGLHELTLLDLNNNGLEELSANLFSGLSKLSVLDLRNNRLERLPPGIFSGLTSLTFLILRENPGSDFEMLLEFERVRPDTPESAEVRLVLLEGAPFNIPVSFSAQGATVWPERMRFPVGTTRSGVITVTRTDDSTVTVTQVVETPFTTSGVHVVSGAPLVMESLAPAEEAVFERVTQDEIVGPIAAGEIPRERALAADRDAESVQSAVTAAADSTALSLQAEPGTVKVTLGKGSAEFTLTTSPLLGEGQEVQVVLSFDEHFPDTNHPIPMGVKFDGSSEESYHTRLLVTLNGDMPSTTVSVSARGEGPGAAEVGLISPVYFSVQREQGVTVTPLQTGESLLKVRVAPPPVKLRIRVFLENALE